MSEWKEITLGDVVTFQRGHDLPKSKFVKGKYPILGSNGIIGYHNEYTAEENGIVIGRSGNIGKPVFVKTKFWAHNTTLCVKKFHNSDPKFVYYLLKTLNFDNINSGSAVPSLNRNYIHPYPVKIPLINEQRSIADVLSSLDNKIDLLRRQNETLEKIAQTLFKRWFVDFEFPNESGKPYKSSGGNMVPSELGETPYGWNVGKLGDYCTIFRGSSPRPITSPVFFSNGTIPWIKIADATRSTSFYISETKEFCTEQALPYTRYLKKGSLILSNSATVGIPMILNLNGCIHDGWLSFKDYKIISRNFLFFLLMKKLKFLIHYADGSVQKNLNTGILKEMEFIIPQVTITKRFDQISQVFFDKILKNEDEVQTLTKLRDSLLPKLMSGKVRVKE